MRRFFVAREAILSGRPTLTGANVKHIRTVLRLKPGDEVALFDGQGRDYLARIEAATQKAVTLKVLRQFPSIAESPVQITIGQALLKGKKMDRVVRQVTELGVHALIPVLARRSVSRPTAERWHQREKRWQAIAEESLKQCGRSQALRLEPPTSFETAVDTFGDYDLAVIFHHDESLSRSERHLSNGGQIHKVLALVGPEGGFATEEVMPAVNAGFHCISLGPRILKADTAVVAACAVLQHAFGDMAGLPKKP